MSKIESGMRVVLAFTEAFNRHDIDSMMKLISDDCVMDDFAGSPDGNKYSGKQEITRFWKDSFHLSPNIHIEIEDIFGFGYRCIMRWKYKWINDSGENQYIRGVDIYKVRDDLICEKLSYIKG
jgi:hypothetical protein